MKRSDQIGFDENRACHSTGTPDYEDGPEHERDHSL
jgi:hypothetical protein